MSGTTHGGKKSDEETDFWLTAPVDRDNPFIHVRVKAQCINRAPFIPANEVFFTRLVRIDDTDGTDDDWHETLDAFVVARKVWRFQRPMELEVTQILALDTEGPPKLVGLTCERVNQWLLGEEYAIRRRDKERLTLELREKIAPFLERADELPHLMDPMERTDW